MKPPFTYFGGKTRIADRIASLLPDHDHYVEPFAGSLSVLLAKPRSPMETVNDLDRSIMDFWRLLRDRTDDLMRACALTPHSRAEHQCAYEPCDDELESARRLWVRLTQARSSQPFRGTGWRYYQDPKGSHSSMPDYLAAYVARLGPAAERIAGVSLECLPALDLIGRYGQHADCLLYADPPYLESARRSAGRGPSYGHEMRTEAEHRELAGALGAARAAVVLSGYRSPLYDELYGGWHQVELAGYAGNAATGAALRTEVLWSNRPFAVAQASLFEVGGGCRLVIASPWRLSHRSDPAALPLANRHYNRQKPDSPQFVPPGRCLVLLAADRSALWVTSWPFAEYARHAWAGAWVNSLFRNEGDGLSSDLIRHAVAHTRATWPAEPPLGMITFVDASKVRRKRDPGRCYRKAGFTHAGFTAGGLWAFQMLPADMPGPEAVPLTQMELFGGEVA